MPCRRQLVLTCPCAPRHAAGRPRIPAAAPWRKRLLRTGQGIPNAEDSKNKVPSSGGLPSQFRLALPSAVSDTKQSVTYEV